MRRALLALAACALTLGLAAGTASANGYHAYAGAHVNYHAGYGGYRYGGYRYGGHAGYYGSYRVWDGHYGHYRYYDRDRCCWYYWNAGHRCYYPATFCP
jgi:hypothetical protein